MNNIKKILDNNRIYVVYLLLSSKLYIYIGVQENVKNGGTTSSVIVNVIAVSNELPSGGGSPLIAHSSGLVVSCLHRASQ